VTTDLDQRLFRPGPKRILALDGGGVHGVLSLAMLCRIEEVLARRAPDPAAFRLADYYDLIGGTSTGSLIATGLSLGMRATELLELYRDLARDVFRRRLWTVGLFDPKFRSKPLMRVLDRIVGKMRLDDARLRTGLVIVTKRLDTGSTWVLHNNPRSRYFDPPADDPDATPNRSILLADAIMASVAAPSYFKPRLMSVTGTTKGAFVDGGVSPHNNPSLMLLMVATAEGFGYHWQPGVENLLLTSMGTGLTRRPRSLTSISWTPALIMAAQSLLTMMHDSNLQTQALLQWMGHSPTARIINPEIGDLSRDRIPGGDLLWYLRYDAELSAEWLGKIGVHVSASELTAMKNFDQPGNIERLIEIGEKVAARDVRDEHFPAGFDV
jgi:uncharacterized protein